MLQITNSWLHLSCSSVLVYLVFYGIVAAWMLHLMYSCLIVCRILLNGQWSLLRHVICLIDQLYIMWLQDIFCELQWLGSWYWLHIYKLDYMTDTHFWRVGTDRCILDVLWSFVFFLSVCHGAFAINLVFCDSGVFRSALLAYFVFCGLLGVPLV